jgi:hypothetical protein
MNRDEVKFITLKTYNKLLESNYANIKELIFNTPSFRDELEIRSKLALSPYDLSAIFVVDEIPNGKIEIFLHSDTYSDVKEVLVTSI